MEVDMEWLSNNGEVYHRDCVHWTAAIEAGKCERCGEPISEPILQLARAQCEDRKRIVRDRDVRRSLKSLSQRFAAMEAKTSAMLHRTPREPESGEKG